MPKDSNILARETLIDKINKLCEWYEKNKPDAGQRIEVVASPMQLAKALGHDLPKSADGKTIQKREWTHRSRTIVATGSES